MDLALLKTGTYDSREEFRRWCEAQPTGRYERVDGRIVHPTRRTFTHRRRAGDGSDTTIIVNGPIAMDPPGIVISAEEIYGATQDG